MKSFVVFVCLLVAQLGTCAPGRAERNLVVAAIREVLVKYFVKSYHQIDLMIIGARGGIAESMAADLIRKLPEGITMQVSRLNASDYRIFHSSVIVLADPAKPGERSLPLVRYHGKDTWFKNLVYAPGVSNEDVQKLYTYMSVIGETNFFTNYDGNSIELSAGYLYSFGKCNQNIIKTVNRFSRKTGTWAHSDFYPNKYLDLGKCIVEVSYCEELTNDVGKIIMETLIGQANGTLFRYLMTKEAFEYMLKNIKLTEEISMQTTEKTVNVLSSAIYFHEMTFVVPPGKALTDLERMFTAFDDDTWIAIGSTFILALIAIVFIKFLSRKAQDLIFGLGITTPILNLFDIFINGGQNRAPIGSFARYLLTMFTIWSLIFRTCYQSMMFEHMNSDMRHPRVQTIDELKEKNFTLVYYENQTNWVTNFSTNYENIKLLSDNTSWYDIVPEPLAKLTHLIARLDYSKLLKTMIDETVPSTHLLEENSVTVPYFIVLPSGYSFCEAFKERIDQMLANGMILKVFEKFYLIEKDKKKYAEKVAPQVMAVHHLQLGFLLYLICLTVSFIVFLIELSVHATKSWISTVVGYFVVKAFVINYPRSMF